MTDERKSEVERVVPLPSQLTASAPAKLTKTRQDITQSSGRVAAGPEPYSAGLTVGEGLWHFNV